MGSQTSEGLETPFGGFEQWKNLFFPTAVSMDWKGRESRNRQSRFLFVKIVTVRNHEHLKQRSDPIGKKSKRENQKKL